MRTACSRLSLPRISIRQADAVSQLRDVCSQDGPGFFYLAMEPDELAAADEMLRVSRQFFDLDLPQKEALRNGSEQFFRYQGVRIPASGPGYRPAAGDANFKSDSRESFNIGRGDISNDDPQRPYGSTPWPEEELAPGFRDASEAYANLLCEKSCALRIHLAEALGVDKKFFDAPGLFDRSPWLLGMVHYLPRPSDVAKRRFGITPHQDDGIFTLLYTDGTPGLQICPDWKGSAVHRADEMLDPKLAWHDVEPLPGHWVVNLGTQLSRWSGGRFKATLHRVVTDAECPKHRYSVPFFYEANLDASLSPISVAEASETAAKKPRLDKGATPGDILLDMAKRDNLELIYEEER